MALLSIVQPRAPLVDPHDCIDAADALSILGALHAAPVRSVGPGRFAPDLAQGWTAAPGARVRTFTLRPGLRLRNGRPIDAGVAAASVSRMARPDVGATLAAPAVWAQYLGGATVEALDALRLRVTLAAPMADLLDVLASARALDPEALDDPLAAGVGAGPFALASRGPDHAQARATQARPGPDALRWCAEPDAGARLAAVRAGRAQVAVGAPWRTLAAAGRTLARIFSPTMIVFLFNCDRPAVAAPRVRRALNLCIDRAALAQAALAGAATAQHGVFGPARLDHAPSPQPCGRAEARRLLREAGEGLALTIDAPTCLPDEAQALCAALAAQLAMVGVACAFRAMKCRRQIVALSRAQQGRVWGSMGHLA